MSLATASLAVCQASGLAAQSRRQQQQQRRGRAAVLVVRAADTPNLSGGLTTTNSSLLGPKPNLGGSLSSGPSLGPKLSTGRPQISLDDVQLKSGVSAGSRFSACLPCFAASLPSCVTSNCLTLPATCAWQTRQ